MLQGFSPAKCIEGGRFPVYLWDQESRHFTAGREKEKKNALENVLEIVNIGTKDSNEIYLFEAF